MEWRRMTLVISWFLTATELLYGFVVHDVSLQQVLGEDPASAMFWSHHFLNWQDRKIQKILWLEGAKES